MKSIRGLLSLALIFSTAFIVFTTPLRHAIAQEVNIALHRGYRTGYSDGYMAGYRDLLDSKTKDFAQHSDYASADRAFSKDYGPVGDYRNGYQQGFELGYDAGFEKRSFDSAVPSTLALREANGSTAVIPVPTTTGPAPTDQTVTQTPVPTDTTAPPVITPTTTTTPATTANETTAVTTKPISIQTDTGSITIAKGTELILELQNPLSTDKNREGDTFTAKVVSPIELSGATIEGRVNKIQKPGRIKRRSELAMSFDRIVINESRWGNFSAVLTEVMPVKGDNVRRVDDEGMAVGKSTIKPDAIKVGAATGSGAAIGAIAGGPVGAAVGAGVGVAFGVGAVVIERGKDIRLNANQQLRVKSAYDTQIR
jgi:hypothetical protein